MLPKDDVLQSKKDKTFQAVVIADSYVNRFGPLTKETPKCLLPFAGRCIIDVALECIILSGVEETIVYCTSHASQIKNHLEQNFSECSMTIKIITNEDCCSFGDAMRDLDGKGVLRHHFVLLHADTVSNINLLPLLNEHLSNKDPSNIMTLVTTQGISRRLDEELILVLNGSNRLLHYQSRKSAGRKVNFPIEIFREKEIRIRSNLIHSSICFCSPAVLSLFSDNFDCQNLSEFIQEILQNDLVESTIYVSEVFNAYAARISNLQSYFSCSMDCLNRWLYPIVPDSMSRTKRKKEFYTSRHNIYRSNDVILKKGSYLKEDVIIGQGSVIGENTVIARCSIGSGVLIGQNVLLNDSILMDNVIIGDGSICNSCIIGSNVIIESSVIIEPKSVLGPNVQISKGQRVVSGSLLASDPNDDEDDFFSSSKESSFKNKTYSSSYGPKAYSYRLPESFEDDNDDDDEDDKEENEQNKNKENEDFWGSYPSFEENNNGSYYSSSSSSDEESLDSQELVVDSQTYLSEEDYHYEVFHKEVYESLTRGVEEGVKSENLILEINSSKHAYNVSLSQVNTSLVTNLLLLGLCERRGEKTSGRQLYSSLIKILSTFTSLLNNYIKSSSAEMDVIKAIESMVRSEKSDTNFLTLCPKIFEYLYNREILSEETILEWFTQLEDITIKEKVSPLIEWLQQSSEESDSEN